MYFRHKNMLINCFICQQILDTIESQKVTTNTWSENTVIFRQFFVLNRKSAFLIRYINNENDVLFGMVICYFRLKMGDSSTYNDSIEDEQKKM